MHNAQLYWEAFPAGSGPADRTSYMFTYLDAQVSSCCAGRCCRRCCCRSCCRSCCPHVSAPPLAPPASLHSAAQPNRPSLEALMETYWREMPRYQGISLDDLQVGAGQGRTAPGKLQHAGHAATSIVHRCLSTALASCLGLHRPDPVLQHPSPCPPSSCRCNASSLEPSPPSGGRRCARRSLGCCKSATPGTAWVWEARAGTVRVGRVSGGLRLSALPPRCPSAFAASTCSHPSLTPAPTSCLGALPLPLPPPRLPPCSGIQSPLSFGGFGALTRHLKRLAGAIGEALEADCLSISGGAGQSVEQYDY